MAKKAVNADMATEINIVESWRIKNIPMYFVVKNNKRS